MRYFMGILMLCLAVLPSSAAVADAQQTQPLTIESVVLRPLRAAEVPAQQTGLLQKIIVEEGQQVTVGQLLASLDDRQAKLAVTRAEIEFAQADAEAKNEISILYADKALEVAKAELQRSLESIEQFPKSISQSQLDVERLTIEKLTLERQQAEHEQVLEKYAVQQKKSEVETAKLQLDQHHLSAPFSGRVVLIRGRAGEWVEVGDPVLRLVATDKLRAEGFLPMAQADAKLVGTPVTLSVGEGDSATEIVGVLRFMSPEMEPVTKQVRVWAEIPNDKGLLRPGQRGSLEFSK